MRRVALKGLWLRRGRAALTVLAVVLGVAMVSGTYVLTDTIRSAFEGIFTSGYRNVSAVVTPRQVVEFSDSGAPTVPASLLDRVRAVAGVEQASGALLENQGSADAATIVGPDGEPAGSANAPKLGFGIDPDATRFNPLTLTSGRWASGEGEVVIDRGTAEEEGLAVGDRVRIAGRGPAEPFEVVGIARYGNVNSLGGATIAVFDVPVAQRLLGKQGYDTVFAAAEPGLAPEALVARLREALPRSVRVRTGAAEASADAADIEEGLAFIRYFLLAFAAIALGVGAFVIANTLSITVAQRTRELATLRTLGASARQVRRSVVTEGLVMGAVASVVGVFAGLLLARGLSGVFRALGIDLPQTDQVLEPRTVVVSLALGVVVTTLASALPARRAMRVPPVAALQEGARAAVEGDGGRRQGLAYAAAAIAVALLAGGAFGGLEPGPALALLGGGCVALFVGVSLLARRLVVPLAAVTGAPARRLGPAGRLAHRNAMRNPARTASTAAALMIGLALVTVVATLGEGLRQSDREHLEQTVDADFVVTSENGFDSIPAEAGEAVAGVAGVRSVQPVREDVARAFGKSVSINGLPADFREALDVRMPADVRLGRGDAIVEADYAAEHGLSAGEGFTVRTAAGAPVELTVAGVYERRPIESIDPLLGKVLVSQETFDASFPRPGDQFAFVQAPGAGRDAIAAAVADFPGVEVATRAAWIDDRVRGIDMLLNLLYVLLALSVVVSLFGMVNTLVLSIFERTREIGMLRAVGMNRRQVRRMVRHESVITALIGAALGLPLGLFLAALISSALADQGLTFAVPFGSLIVFTIVAVLAGVLAAIAPARRAARLDVLRALQYE